jgi:hypothetical protein
VPFAAPGGVVDPPEARHRVGAGRGLGGAARRRLVPLLPRRLVYMRWNVWGRGRELPTLPQDSFRALYRRRHGKS